MFNRWFRRLNEFRPLPQSILQSPENPIQLDRMPKGRRGELEYPTHRHSAEEDRRHTLWLLALAPLVAIAAYFIETVFQTYWIATYVFGLLATAALYVFFLTFFAQRKSRWRWLVYFPGIPFIGFALCVLRDAYLFLVVGFVLSAILADGFATHFFYLKTTVPMARRRSRKLRRLWRRRFRFSGPAANGVEFYKLACLTPLAAALYLFAISRGTPPGYILPNMAFILSGLALLLAVPLLIEWAVTHFFHHRRVPPKAMFRAFRAAIVQWFTYNRHNAAGPCVFQSPVGSYAQRRRLTVAAIFVLSAASAQLFSAHRQGVYEYDKLRPEIRDHSPRSLWDKAQDLLWLRNRGFRPDDRQSRFAAPQASALTLAATFPTRAAARPGHALALLQSDAPAESTHGFPIYSRNFNPQPDNSAASKPLPHGLELEPYQEAMLRRMSAEQQEEYLAKLRAEQPPPGPAPKQFNDKLDENGFRYFLTAMWLLGMFLVVVVIPAVCSLLPPLLFLACCFTTSARVIGFYGRELGTDDPEKLLHSDTWDRLVQRIRSSRDDIEQHSLLLGVNANDDTPVIIPRSILREHAHILGDSGSGKTSLGLASIMTQLIRFGDCSIVVLDMKGDDQALFEGARIEAEQAQLPFRWFTNQLDHSSHIFNPLTQRHLQGLSLYQRTDMVTTALGLQYGTDYGQSYFSSANAERLYMIYEDEPNVSSFARMAQLVKQPTRDLPPDLRSSVGHIRACLSRMAECEPLNAHAGLCEKPSALDHAIEMTDLFTAPQVVYFALPAAVSTTYGPEIARLALYSLLGAARAVHDRKTQVFVIIDEFQRVIAHNLDLIFQVARSMNIGLILANQTLADLKTATKDLVPTIRTNTRLKQIFAASDLAEQRALVEASGETLYHTRSWSEYLGAMTGVMSVTSVNVSEFISPRLRLNDILLASDHPYQSIVSISRGAGYAQYGGFPFVATSVHHIDHGEYTRRKRQRWPAETPETLVARLKPTKQKPTTQPPGTPEPAPESPPALPPTDPVIGAPGTTIDTIPKRPPVLPDLDAHFGTQTQRPGADKIKQSLKERKKNQKSPRNQTPSEEEHP